MAPVARAGRVDARTVLLADDDENFRAALAEALDDDGCDVVAVRNGAVALPALERAANDHHEFGAMLGQPADEEAASLAS